MKRLSEVLRGPYEKGAAHFANVGERRSRVNAKPLLAHEEDLS